jgi:hypothetical protein
MGHEPKTCGCLVGIEADWFAAALTSFDFSRRQTAVQGWSAKMCPIHRGIVIAFSQLTDALAAKDRESNRLDVFNLHSHSKSKFFTTHALALRLL